jgi:hypothetical protein
MYMSNVLIKQSPYLLTMTLDEKIRIGMIALTGASFVMAALGLKLGPLEPIGGIGAG